MAVYTLLLLGDRAVPRRYRLRRRGTALFAHRRVSHRDAVVLAWRCSGTRGSACATSGWITSSRRRLRLALEVLTVIVLVGYAAWLVEILWRPGR